MFCSDYKGLYNFGSEYRSSHLIDAYRKCITSLIGMNLFIGTEILNQKTAVPFSEGLVAGYYKLFIESQFVRLEHRRSVSYRFSYPS